MSTGSNERSTNNFSIDQLVTLLDSYSLYYMDWPWSLECLVAEWFLGEGWPLKGGTEGQNVGAGRHLIKELKNGWQMTIFLKNVINWVKDGKSFPHSYLICLHTVKNCSNIATQMARSRGQPDIGLQNISMPLRIGQKTLELSNIPF